MVDILPILLGILLGTTIIILLAIKSNRFLKRNQLIYDIRTSFSNDGRGYYVYLPSYEHMMKKDKKLKTKKDFEDKYVPKLFILNGTVNE